MIIEEVVKEKTTFICRFLYFQFEVMQFEIMNAPYIFNRLMDESVKVLKFLGSF